MSLSPYRTLTALRVRIDECDRTGSITFGRLVSMADEARFALYADLIAQGIPLPRSESAKAERLVVHRPPRRSEEITIEAYLGRVGTTSFDVEQILRGADGVALAEFSSTIVALEGGRPTACAHELRRAVVAPLGLVVESPHDPDGSVAFLRTVDAWPSDENTGGHVARTRMIDWLVDARRIGAARGAFEHEGANADARVARMSIAYERESFAGDGLRIAIASAGPDVFDATLTRAGAIVARARMLTRTDV